MSRRSRERGYRVGEDVRRSGERGSVTVELAAALPAVVLVLALMVAALAWARSGIEVTQAAALGARIAAVEGPAAARAEIESSLPGADAKVSVTDGRVSVQVSLDVQAWLPTASATAVARASRP